MLITITIVSILIITFAVWLVARAVPFTACPICAGVFLTWLGLLGARGMGYEVDAVIPAILMGGSVVGIAYQLEKKLNAVSQDTRLFFKTLFMSAGFIAAYAILVQWWIALLLAATFLAAVSGWFVFSNRVVRLQKEAIGDIEKKMEECC